MPALKPPTADPRSILGFYRLGTYVRRRYQQQMALKDAKQYVRGVALDVAKRCQISRSTVDFARLFAGRYTLVKAKRLHRLRTKGGNRLNRRHVISLLFLSPKQANALTALVCQNDWSACRLELEVKRLRPKRRAGGRRPRPAKPGPETVIQMVDSSERWLHRYRTQVSKSQLKNPLREYRGVARQLRRAHDALSAAVRLAQRRLYGPSSRKRRGKSLGQRDQ